MGTAEKENNGLKITEIRFFEPYSFHGPNPPIAIASLVFNDLFTVKGILVYGDGEDICIMFPTKKLAPGNYAHIAHPITETFSVFIKNAIKSALSERERNFRAGDSWD